MRWLSAAFFLTLASLLLALSAVAESATGAADLGRIVVSANLRRERERAVPRSVDVVSRGEIARKGARTAAEALRDLPGVDLVSLGSPGEDLDVRVRGSDRDEVLVLLDGIPVNNAVESRAVILESVPAELIERIEVLRGAQSVAHGGGAGGGVINVVTRKAGEAPEFGFAAAAGNLAAFRESVFAARRFDVHSFVSGYSRADAGGRFANDRYGANAAFLKYDFTPGDVFRLRLGVNSLRQEQELAFGSALSFANFPTVNYHVTRDFDRSLRRDTVVPRIAVTLRPVDFYRARLAYSLYFEDMRLDNSNAGEIPPEAAAVIDTQRFDSTSYRHRFDTRHRFDLPDIGPVKAVLTAGATVELESLEYTDAPFPGDATAETTTVFPDTAAGQKGDRRNYAGYVLASAVIADNLTVDAGARYDSNSTYGSSLSPRVSAGYRLTKTGTRVFTGYSRGFFAPTLNQYYLAVIGGTLVQRLDKEVSDTFEVGVEQDIGGKRARAGVTFFYTDYDTFIDGVQLINDARVLGLETRARVKPLKWARLEANYTFMNSKNSATGAALADRPAHRANIEAVVTPLRNWDVTAGVRVVSERRIPNVLSTQALGDLPIAFFDASGNPAATNLPAHATVRLGSRYTQKLKGKGPKEIVYSFKINNLLNSSYQEKFGYPMPRLSFLAGAEVRF